MDPWLLLAGLVAAAAACAAIWLLVERGRLLSRAESSRAQLESSEAARRRADSEREDRDRRIRELEIETRGLSEQKSVLDALVGAERERLARETLAHEARVSDLRREFADREKQMQSFVAQRDAELTQRFKALSADTLKDANEKLLQVAAQQFAAQQKYGASELEKREIAVTNLVKPIAESLQRADEKLALMQKEWTQDRSSLQAEMKSIGAAGESLRLETLKLSRALSKPEVRGRYGEMQLRRVADLAGMTAYCDFFEQTSQRDLDGRLRRPDMTVSYPNGRFIAVDAKCNILAYIEAIDAPSEEAREACLERFAEHVESQAAALGKKAYWSEFDGSPEFVVMFVPGDQFVDAALARRGDLLERAAEHGVILATPSTLIGLLRAVAIGWREKRVEDQARELIALGRELHDRASVAFAHAGKLGEALETASRRYNDFVGSYESRLEPALRKFEDAGVKSSKERPSLSPANTRVRAIASSIGNAAVPVLPSASTNGEQRPESDHADGEQLPG
jgi:DNA recombination protein RmuC